MGKSLYLTVLFLLFTSLPSYCLPKGCTVWGQVLCDGKAVQGAVITDSDEIAVTDRKGFYYLNSAKRSGIVSISIPSGCEVACIDGMPAFWQRLSPEAGLVERHDFSLTAADNSRHAVIALTDIHLANNWDDNRQFQDVFMPRLRQEVEKCRREGYRVYAVNMGDSSYDRYWYEYDYSIGSFPGTLKEAAFPVPMFCTMGNHDNDGATMQGVQVDFRAEAAYRDAMGPVRYSFNLGEVHYIMIDNVVYKNSEGRVDNYDGIVGKRDYDVYFTPETLSWLQKDLATVKDRIAPLVVAFHCPAIEYKSGLSTNPIRSRLKKDGADPDSLLNEFTALFKDFPSVHFLTGHTHKNLLCRGSDDTSKYPYIANITDHNITAVCGCWWQTKAQGGLSLSCDGGPSGFEVFHMDGKDMDWYFVSNDDGASEQFRVFDMNAVRDYYRQSREVQLMLRHYPERTDYRNVEDNLVLINVWAWENTWKIEVTENGKALDVKQKKMENPQYTLSYYLPKMSWEDGLSKQRWAEKYGAPAPNPHIFCVHASSAESTLVVTVTDGFGRRYTRTVERPKAFSKLMR